VLTGAVLAACSDSGSDSSASSGTSASGTSSSAAVCDSADDLRTSLAALGDVDVVSQGTDALQQAFATVRTDLSDLGDQARGQFSGEVTAAEAAADDVQEALDAALAAPSAQTLGAAATAVGGLVTDAGALVTAVTSTC